MSQLDGIEFLTATVEAGSFAEAARRLGVTPSAVSRRVAQLERELGAQLLARTTRSLRLTDDGRAFYERCARALEELHEARDALARANRSPAGVLRVDAPTALGRELLVPRVPEFLARYPQVRLELTLQDRFVDPVVEGLDVLVRIGPLRDSSLFARRLGQSRLVACAAPSYLRRRGVPKQPADLASHDCIGYLREGRPGAFIFIDDDGAERPVEIAGRCHGNDAQIIRQFALEGQGIAMLFDFLVAGPIASGALVAVLEAHRAMVWPIHALYPKNRHLLPKVEAFLGFLGEAFGGAPKRARRRPGGTPPERAPL